MEPKNDAVYVIKSMVEDMVQVSFNCCRDANEDVQNNFQGEFLLEEESETKMKFGIHKNNVIINSSGVFLDKNISHIDHLLTTEIQTEEKIFPGYFSEKIDCPLPEPTHIASEILNNLSNFLDIPYTLMNQAGKLQTNINYSYLPGGNVYVDEGNYYFFSSENFCVTASIENIMHNTEKKENLHNRDENKNCLLTPKMNCLYTNLSSEVSRPNTTNIKDVFLTAENMKASPVITKEGTVMEEVQSFYNNREVNLPKSTTKRKQHCKCLPKHKINNNKVKKDFIPKKFNVRRGKFKNPTSNRRGMKFRSDVLKSGSQFQNHSIIIQPMFYDETGTPYFQAINWNNTLNQDLLLRNASFPISKRANGNKVFNSTNLYPLQRIYNVSHPKNNSFSNDAFDNTIPQLSSSSFKNNNCNENNNNSAFNSITSKSSFKILYIEENTTPRVSISEFNILYNNQENVCKEVKHSSSGTSMYGLNRNESHYSLPLSQTSSTSEIYYDAYSSSQFSLHESQSHYFSAHELPLWQPDKTLRGKSSANLNVFSTNESSIRSHSKKLREKSISTLNVNSFHKNGESSGDSSPFSNSPNNSQETLSFYLKNSISENLKERISSYTQEKFNPDRYISEKKIFSRELLHQKDITFQNESNLEDEKNKLKIKSNNIPKIEINSIDRQNSLKDAKTETEEKIKIDEYEKDKENISMDEKLKYDNRIVEKNSTNFDGIFKWFSVNKGTPKYNEMSEEESTLESGIQQSGELKRQNEIVQYKGIEIKNEKKYFLDYTTYEDEITALKNSLYILFYNIIITFCGEDSTEKKSKQICIMGLESNDSSKEILGNEKNFDERVTTSNTEQEEVINNEVYIEQTKEIKEGPSLVLPEGIENASSYQGEIIKKDEGSLVGSKHKFHDNELNSVDCRKNRSSSQKRKKKYKQKLSHALGELSRKSQSNEYGNEKEIDAKLNNGGKISTSDDGFILHNSQNENSETDKQVITFKESPTGSNKSVNEVLPKKKKSIFHWAAKFFFKQ